jgi:hypothetical protein
MNSSRLQPDRPTTPAKRNRWKSLPAIVLLLVILFLAWPKLAGFGYHVMHSGTVTIQGARVPVPRDFFAIRSTSAADKRVLSLYSASFDVPFRHEPLTSIIFYRLQQDHPFRHDQDAQLMSATTDAAKNSGFNLAAVRESRNSSRTNYCLEFASTKSPRTILERCFIEGSTLVAYFEGDPQYRADLDSILRGLAFH